MPQSSAHLPAWDRHLHIRRNRLESSALPWIPCTLILLADPSWPLLQSGQPGVCSDCGCLWKQRDFFTWVDKLCNVDGYVKIWERGFQKIETLDTRHLRQRGACCAWEAQWKPNSCSEVSNGKEDRIWDERGSQRIINVDMVIILDFFEIHEKL